MLNMKLEACSGQVLGQMPKIAKVQTGLASNGPEKSKFETGSHTPSPLSPLPHPHPPPPT